MLHEISFQLPLHNVLSCQVIRHDSSISCHRLLSVLCSDNRLFGYRFYAGISGISLYPVFLLMLRTAQVLSALLQDNWRVAMDIAKVFDTTVEDIFTFEEDDA